MESYRASKSLFACRYCDKEHEKSKDMYPAFRKLDFFLYESDKTRQFYQRKNSEYWFMKTNLEPQMSMKLWERRINWEQNNTRLKKG